jgi:hypothetical protein
MIKAGVAVVDEGRSSVVIRDVRCGIGLNQEDFGGGRINSSALEVACGPPGIGAKTIQESSRNSASEVLT